MSADVSRKPQIENSIKGFSTQPLDKAAFHLLDVLGYKSDRHLSLTPNSPVQFLLEFDSAESPFNKTNACFFDWKSIDLLSQITDEEINAALGQKNLFSAKQIDNTIINSYLFFAIQLKAEHYNRTELANITREVNKLFKMPVMLFLCYGQNLSIGIITRRVNKKDAGKDVLEKVTLIKDIDIQAPHRAHTEILFDLSIQELIRNNPLTNFVDLQRAWVKTLDTNELNKKFYKEIANWYFWALSKVQFPTGNEELGVSNNNEMSVIRLITRLIFVWFLKEKGLVSEELFWEEKVKKIIKFEDKNRSTYYKSILQNLFFATLNQEMNTKEFPDRRKFRTRYDNPGSRDGNRLITNLYRYEQYFIDSQKALGEFSKTPFLNGGLFECLDREVDHEGKNVVIRIDGFSDEENNLLLVPDEIFFSPQLEFDLNEIFDTKNKKYEVRGILRILNRYKFTVEENTPITEEVALDPELLGKVFENLLAAYNPETSTTARKQTGSYYTPREIVNYMIDESLLTYFISRLDAEGVDEAKNRLQHLLAYNDEPHKFSDSEVEMLIHAIDAVKILDPACGSGAFPMGALHKLVHVLFHLDPNNERWQALQLQKAVKETEVAFREDGRAERQERLKDIEEAFTRNTSDYGRKLYLIENCIYGIDIQPIAVQISRLRFFISLIVDQTPDKSKDNLGIRPLPNLETKFVAANSLIGIEKPQQMILRNPVIGELETDLTEVRRKHFNARTPQTKRKYRIEDNRLRKELSKLLKKDGYQQSETEKLAGWNPYDQNMSAGFFDPEWMFGLSNGFNIIVGNPPYVGHKGGQKKLFNILRETSLGIRFNNERMDLFYYFFHKSIDLANEGGIISFITTNYFGTADSAIKLRSDIKKRTKVLTIINFNELKIFESALGQHNQITTIQKVYSPESFCKIIVTKRSEVATKHILETILNGDDKETIYRLIKNENLFEGEMQYISSVNAGVVNAVEIEKILNKMKSNTYKLGDICHISQGIVTGLDKITNRHLKRTSITRETLGDGCYVISNTKYCQLGLDSALYANRIKPWYKNSDITRYFTSRINSEWLIYATTVSNIDKYEKIYSHLLAYESAIKSRNYDSGELSKAKKLGTWWALSSARLDFDFTAPKIVSPQRSYENTFGYNEIEWYASADVYFITQKSHKVHLKFILALLNSKLFYLWLYFKGKRKGEMLELYLKPLSEIPIPLVTMTVQKSFVEKMESILSLEFQRDEVNNIISIENQIDNLIYQVYGFSQSEIDSIENTFVELKARQNHSNK